MQQFRSSRDTPTQDQIPPDYYTIFVNEYTALLDKYSIAEHIYHIAECIHRIAEHIRDTLTKLVDQYAACSQRRE